MDLLDESAFSQLAVPDSIKINAPPLLLGATYSNTDVQFHILDQYRQTQTRFTGFPIFMCLNDDAGIVARLRPDQKSVYQSIVFRV